MKVEQMTNENLAMCLNAYYYMGTKTPRQRRLVAQIKKEMKKRKLI